MATIGPNAESVCLLSLPPSQICCFTELRLWGMLRRRGMLMTLDGLQCLLRCSELSLLAAQDQGSNQKGQQAPEDMQDVDQPARWGSLMNEPALKLQQQTSKRPVGTCASNAQRSGPRDAQEMVRAHLGSDNAAVIALDVRLSLSMPMHSQVRPAYSGKAFWCLLGYLVPSPRLMLICCPYDHETDLAWVLHAASRHAA